MQRNEENPYAQLAAEIQCRGNELFAEAQSKGLVTGAWCEKLTALVKEGDQRFAELLASRQATISLDFDALYERKAQLDRRLSERDS